MGIIFSCNETLIVTLVDKIRGKNAQAAMQQTENIQNSDFSGADSLKVLVVDDSKMIRRVICDIINANGTMQVVGEAENGKRALELIKTSNPDVITLDINMPVMDGLTTLKHIMIQQPKPTVMISSLTQEGAIETFESLKYGAIDFLPKPSKVRGGDLKSQQNEIIRKILLASEVQMKSIRFLRRPTMEKMQTSDETPECRCIIAFGASEGGYGALLNVVPRLQKGLAAACVAMMHQAPQHVDAFSHYLNQCSYINVERAVDGAQIKGGTCYIAASNEYVTVQQNDQMLKLQITSDQSQSKGSNIDQFMTSLATVMQERAIGVILTGTGHDGLEGIGEIIKAKGTVFVQDPSSCLFKETPVTAIKTYPIDYLVGDKQMAGAINDYINSLTR